MRLNPALGPVGRQLQSSTVRVARTVIRRRAIGEHTVADHKDLFGPIWTYAIMPIVDEGRVHCELSDVVRPPYRERIDAPPPIIWRSRGVIDARRQAQIDCLLESEIASMPREKLDESVEFR